ncbi:MAG TPA: transposase [Thermoanaerobaculia bacterium]|nr:transposase [Thermoanaerobaculia bacterium]
MVKKSLLQSITDVRVRSRGYVPHWEQCGATYSLTIRLHDSLPLAVIEQIREQQRVLRRTISGAPMLTAFERAILRAEFEQTVDRELHRGLGVAFMNDPSIAELIAQTIVHFDGERYRLDGWCVMPNHVHAIVTPFDGWPLAGIVRSWKGYSARMANRLLQRDGAFWQREYFDRIIRDEKDLAGCIAYVVENPVKAGLRDWKWTSAAGWKPAARPA